MKQIPLPVLIYIWLVCRFAASQCCQQFNNSKCIKCPENTYILNGSCIIKKRNCLEHQGFECVVCNKNTVLNDRKECINEVQYILKLNNVHFYNDSVRNISNSVQSKSGIRMTLIDVAIYKNISRFSQSSLQNQYSLLRLLYRRNETFIQVVVTPNIVKANSQSKIDSRIKIKRINLIKANKNEVLLGGVESDENKNSLGSLIKEVVKSNKLLGIYKRKKTSWGPKNVGNDTKYRIVYFNQKQGLREQILKI